MVVSSADLRLAVGEVCARVADAGQSTFRELSVLRKLLRWIIDHETQPFNASAVASAIGVDGSTVRRYVQRLVDAGVVVEVAAWRPGVMTRERKRSGYYFDCRTRIAAKLDLKQLTPGGLARSLASYGEVVNYAQGEDISADLVFIPAQSTHRVGAEAVSSCATASLCPALEELGEGATPVAILVVDLTSATVDATSALIAARNQASRISSFFYRTSTRVAVLAALPADFSSTDSTHKAELRDMAGDNVVSQASQHLSLLLHQATSELVPTQLTIGPRT